MTEMSQEEAKGFERMLAELCVVGNTVRYGLNRLFRKLDEAPFDQEVKDIFFVFMTAYTNGHSKQEVRRKLITKMHISEDCADRLCDLPCFDWSE